MLVPCHSSCALKIMSRLLTKLLFLKSYKLISYVGDILFLVDGVS